MTGKITLQPAPDDLWCSHCGAAIFENEYKYNRGMCYACTSDAADAENIVLRGDVEGGKG